MTTEKLEALRAAGWTVGTVQELLGLTDEEMAIVEVCVEACEENCSACENRDSYPCSCWEYR